MTTKINSFKLDERSDYKLTVKYKDKDYPLTLKVLLLMIVLNLD